MAGHPVVARTPQRDPRPVQHDHGGGAGLGAEPQGPLQARSLRRARIQPGLVAQRQAGVGGRNDTQVLCHQTRRARRRRRALSAGRQSDRRVTGPRPEQNGGGEAQSDDPDHQNGLSRPGGRQCLGRPGVQSAQQTRLLQPLQGAETVRISEQQLGAVLHVRARGVQTTHQPGLIEPRDAASHHPQGDHKTDCQNHGHGRQPGEPPHDDGDQADDGQRQQGVVEQGAPPRRPDPGGQQGGGHAPSIRLRRVATQRSISSSPPISKASHGRRSCGA
ncbi:hypothetical protein D3C85_699630 [compost metagenome]